MPGTEHPKFHPAKPGRASSFWPSVHGGEPGLSNEDAHQLRTCGARSTKRVHGRSLASGTRVFKTARQVLRERRCAPRQTGRFQLRNGEADFPCYRRKSAGGYADSRLVQAPAAPSDEAETGDHQAPDNGRPEDQSRPGRQGRPHGHVDHHVPVLTLWPPGLDCWAIADNVHNASTAATMTRFRISVSLPSRHGVERDNVVGIPWRQVTATRSSRPRRLLPGHVLH